jgi:heat shock protein HtpX
MVLTMFLLGLLYVVFIGVLIAAGASLVFVIVIAGALLFFQYYFSDKMALAAMRAKVVEPHEAPELHAMVERLCLQGDIPKPRVAVADTSMPNAFATGRTPKKAVVCVTTGIVDLLEPRELEGVLAHELTHVRNRDVAVMTIASFLAVAAGLLMRMGLFGFGFGGGNGRRNAAPFALILLVSVLVYVISFLLIQALSRYREYAADRGAAIVTGQPSALAAALVKISGVMERVPTRDLRAAQPMNAFFILPARTKESLAELISTHPPVQKRIERLQRLEQQLQGLP